MIVAAIVLLLLTFLVATDSDRPDGPPSDHS
jgi:hypothetical protein